jgi:hypothetical protein
MNPVVRAASLDSFEEHGLLAYTNTKPEIAVDELGRLNKSRVEKPLKISMNMSRYRLYPSSNRCTLLLECCSWRTVPISPAYFFNTQHFASSVSVLRNQTTNSFELGIRWVVEKGLKDWSS